MVCAVISLHTWLCKGFFPRKLFSQKANKKRKFMLQYLLNRDAVAKTIEAKCGDEGVGAASLTRRSVL